jgi:hypothetical protein
VGTEAVVAGNAEPPGLRGVFDEDELDAMERAADRVPGRRRRIALAVAGALAAAVTGLALVNPGAHAGRTAPRPRGPVTLPVTRLEPKPAASHPVRHVPAKHRRKHPAAHRPVHKHRAPKRPVSTQTSSPAPPATTATQAPPSTSGGATVLPAPGGTTLPAP